MIFHKSRWSIYSLPRIIYAHLKEYFTPTTLNYNWSFGALTGIFLIIQMISGIFLSMYYVADTSGAFESVDYIMREVKYGWLMRYSHSNSASFFFICMYAHILRAVFYKSYIAPQNRAWNSGVVLLILSIVVAFLGYVLPWGQMSSWAATVISNLITAIPGRLGKSALEWIWGGQSLNNATLKRFFILHYTLALLLCFIVFVHIKQVHNSGSSNPLGINETKFGARFDKAFSIKDSFIFFIVFFMFIFIVCFHPNLLSHPDNYNKANPLVTPEHIVPEWYFLPFYAILRSVDSKLLGVLLMLFSILILWVLPFSKGNLTVKESSFVGFEMIQKNLFFILFTISVLVLGFVGSSPAVYVYIIFGKVFTFVYFVSYLASFVYNRYSSRIIYWQNKTKNKNDDDTT